MSLSLHVVSTPVLPCRPQRSMLQLDLCPLPSVSLPSNSTISYLCSPALASLGISHQLAASTTAALCPRPSLRCGQLLGGPLSGALLNVFMIAVVEAIALLTGKGSRDARRKLFKGASVHFSVWCPCDLCKRTDTSECAFRQTLAGTRRLPDGLFPWPVRRCRYPSVFCNRLAVQRVAKRMPAASLSWSRVLCCACAWLLSVGTAVEMVGCSLRR